MSKLTNSVNAPDKSLGHIVSIGNNLQSSFSIGHFHTDDLFEVIVLCQLHSLRTFLPYHK